MRRHSACAALMPSPEPDILRGTEPVPLRMTVPDARADGGCRTVEILAHEVVVERSVAGVKMRMAVPFTLYEGVALEVTPDGRGVLLSVRLAHEDRDLDVVLFQASDDRDVAAEWQYWARRCGLPLLVSHGDGRFSEPLPRLGALLVGRTRSRRTPSHFAKRRPRFLTRRRTAKLAEAPIVHHEREIIARD